MKSNTTTIIYALVLFVLLNLISNKLFARFDFTQGQVYTLSDATERIVQGLDKDINVIVFVSETLPPQAVSSKTQLVDKLTEFENLSTGKLNITYVDPVTDESAEELATAFGIPPLDLQVIEEDQAQVIKAYFGLAVTTPTDGEETTNDNDTLSQYADYKVIPVIENLNGLEFELASAMLKVGSDSLKTVAFLQGHGEHTFALPAYYAAMNDDPRADYNVSEELSRNYEVTTIDYSTLSDEEKNNPFAGVSTLIIAGPQQEIPSEELTKIHQFIENGGNAIMLIDSMNVDTRSNFSASRLPVSYYDLLKPWEVNVDPNIIADASHDMASFNQGYITYTLPYPFFAKITNLNLDNSITRDLESFTMPWTSSLDIGEAEDIKYDILASTSSQYQVFTEASTTMPAEAESEAEKIQFTPINLSPQQDFNLQANQDPLPLIVLAEKEGIGKVIIAADSDFVAQGGSDTLLFYNMIDALTLGDDLIQIRSKGVTDRPIDELSNTEKNTIRWGITLGVPILFIIYGLYRRQKRQQKKTS